MRKQNRKPSLLRLLQLSKYESRINESGVTSKDVDEMIDDFTEFNAEVLNFYRNKFGLDSIEKAYSHFMNEKRANEHIITMQVIKRSDDNSTSDKVVKNINGKSFKLELENGILKLYEFTKNTKVSEIYQPVFEFVFKKSKTDNDIKLPPQDVNQFISQVNGSISSSENKEAVINNVYVKANSLNIHAKGVKNASYTVTFTSPIVESKFKEKSKVFFTDSVNFNHVFFIHFKDGQEIIDKTINNIKQAGFVKIDGTNDWRNFQESGYETYAREMSDKSSKYNLVGDKEQNTLTFRKASGPETSVAYEIHFDTTFIKGDFNANYTTNNVVYYKDYITGFNTERDINSKDKYKFGLLIENSLNK